MSFAFSTSNTKEIVEKPVRPWGSENRSWPSDTNRLLIRNRKSLKQGEVYKSRRLVGVEIETHPPQMTDKDSAQFYRLLREFDERIGYGTDGSLGWGIELRTAPKSGLDFEEYIIKVGDLLAQYNCKTSPKCGLHIHLDVNQDFKDPFSQFGFNAEKMSALLLVYAKLEDWIRLTIPKERRLTTGAGNFCRPIKSIVARKGFKSILFDSQMEKRMKDSELRNVWNQRNNHNPKYSGVNINYAYYENNKHVEIRYHEGTTSPADILNWSQLNAKIFDEVSYRWDKQGQEGIDELVEIIDGAPLYRKKTHIPKVLVSEFNLDKGLVNFYKEKIKHYETV